MTTHFRTTYILMGAFAVLLGVLALYVVFDDGKKSSPDGPLLETFANLKIKPGDIDRLEIERAGTRMIFVRQSDGRWRMTQPIDARADSDRVEAIVGEALAARKDDKGADISTLAAHGLDTPAVKLTLNKGERSTWLALGKTTLGGEKAVVYTQSADDPKVPHATRQGRLRSLFKDPAPADTATAALTLDDDDLRSRKLLGEGLALEAAPSQLSSVRLSERLPDGKERVVSLTKRDNIWRFDQPAGFGEVEVELPPEKRNPETIYNLSSLLNNLLSIDVPSAKDFVPDARNLAALGLDPTSPGIIRVDITRGDAIGTETLWIGQPQVKSELDKVYVRYGNDASVAQVNAAKARMLRTLLENPSGLREATLARLNPDRVDAIDVKIGKSLFELRRQAGKWKVKEGDKQYAANTGSIDALLQKLTLREVRGFPPSDATDAALGFDNPTVEIAFWEGGMPKTDGNAWPALKSPPAVRLVFGKKDVGDIVFVRRFLNEAKADFKMPESLLALATKPRLDYVDIALKPFSVNDVRSLSFPRDGTTWEITRTDDAKPAEASSWTIQAPPAMKGKLASPAEIRRILESFNEPTAERVVAEDPTADQLAALGLDPAKPDFKLVLGFKDPAEARTFWLGNDVPGRVSVYAKSGLSNFVFEWPLAKKEMLTKNRLLDPILYRVEPGDVKSMTLRGWAVKPGEPQTLKLDRKPGGIWAAADGSAIDPLLVEDFFQQVSKPQSFEQISGKVDGKLDVKEGALEVSIDAGGAKPITLTLGGPADKEGEHLYASTNQHPGDIFTLNAERLLRVKQDRATLLKK